MKKVKQGYNHYRHNLEDFIPEIGAGIEDTLKPGVYRIMNSMTCPIYFSKYPVATDELINLPNTTSDAVLQEIDTFWKAATKEKFDKYKFVYKRGVLLFGAPGTGKTCTITQVMTKVVKEGGVVFFNPDPSMLVPAVDIVKQIQPDIKILVVWEEFDNIVNSATFLSILDGQLQMENVLYIATTNYIDRIPLRVRNRASRFATVIEVGIPDADTRMLYLKHKLLPEDQQDLQKWVELSEGMVIDQLKDLIISVCCFGRSLDVAVAKIREMDNMAKAEQEEEAYDDDDEDNELYETQN